MKSLKTWQVFVSGILLGLLISATILLIARRSSKIDIQYTSPTQRTQPIQPTAAVFEPTTSPSNTLTPQKININNATISELDSLPGIGEGKAQAIIDYRNVNGNFHSLQDLLYVSGIGQALLSQIQDFIVVE